MRDMFFIDSKVDVPRVFQGCGKVTFRECFRVVFCMLRARVLLLFETFAGGFLRPCAVRDMFFMDSKGDVPRVFQGCVLHASGTNPDAVWTFAGSFLRPCAVKDMFFMDSKGDVPTVFQTCV